MGIGKSRAADTDRVSVALVFPSIPKGATKVSGPQVKGAFDLTVPTLKAFCGETVDFVLFPEGYVSSSDAERIALLSRLGSDLDAPLLVGAEEADETGRIWQTLLQFNPDGSRQRVYTKHSTADAVAFEVPDWEPSVDLPTFELGHIRLGATICHDHYLGLLPRYLAANRAQVWVNPSYDNVVDIKWSSILRLRAVENRFFAFCTLHHNQQKRTATHPFGFGPDGQELHARSAGQENAGPLSACRESEAVYVVEIDVRQAGRPLDWLQLPKATKPQAPRGGTGVPQQPVRVSVRRGGPSVHSAAGWQTVNHSTTVETDCGFTYVGLVPSDRILDAGACFRVLDEAAARGLRPLIWNHWDRLPSDPARIASLMMGRSIECCAPIVLSDTHGVQELVELSQKNKIPARRTVDEYGEATADLQWAWGLSSAFKMVTQRVLPSHLRAHLQELAIDRYRTLA